MGVDKQFNPYTKRWEVTFRGRRWVFDTEEMADAYVAFIKRNYL